MNLDDIKRNRKISGRAEVEVLKDFSFQIGRVIEQARAIKNKTQAELASEINSTQSVIARIENGNKIPSFNFLQRVADALDTYLVPPKFGFMEEVRLANTVNVWVLEVRDSRFRTSGVATTEVKTNEYAKF